MARSKKTVNKKTTTRRKKLDDINQTDGMVDNFEPTTLDQIFGDDGNWKYKTLDKNEYEHYLNGLNKSDLQSHAVNVGIIPIDNKDQLTKRLVREFTRFSSAYKKPNRKKSVDRNVSQDVLDILSEGR